MLDYLTQLFEEYGKVDKLFIASRRPEVSLCTPRLVLEPAATFQLVIPGYVVGAEQFPLVLHQLLHLRRDMLSYTGGLAVGSFGREPRQEEKIIGYQSALLREAHPALEKLRESIDFTLEKARLEARDSLRIKLPSGATRGGDRMVNRGR